MDSSYIERGYERRVVDTKLDQLIEDIGFIVKDLHRKNKELEARNAELVLALEQGNERVVKSELAASTYRKAIDDTLRQACQAIEQAEGAIAAMQRQTESGCATCTGQAAKLILRLQNSAVSVVEQAQREAVTRNQSSQRKLADVLFAAQQTLRSLARQPVPDAPPRWPSSPPGDSELDQLERFAAFGGSAPDRAAADAASAFATGGCDASASISRLLESLHPIQGAAAPAAEPALWEEASSASPHLLDHLAPRLAGGDGPNSGGAPIRYNPALSGTLPNEANVTSAGLTAGTATPRPAAKSITLVASPIRSFSTLSKFHRALKLVAGVVEVTPLAFDRDVLRLAIKHGSSVPLVDQLALLPGFEVRVLSTTQDTVEVSLTQRDL